MQVRVPIGQGNNALTVETLDALGSFDPRAAETLIESRIFFGGPLGIAIVTPGQRALVTDNLLDAVFDVNLATGERRVLSDDSTGTGPGFSFPFAVALDGPRALVVDSGLGLILAVDTQTGERVIRSR